MTLVLNVGIHTAIKKEIKIYTIRLRMGLTTNNYTEESLTLLAPGTNSCKAFILSAILSLRNCTQRENTMLVCGSNGQKTMPYWQEVKEIENYYQCEN